MTLTLSAPVFVAPTLFTPTDLESKPALVDAITDVTNDAFTRSKLPDPVKWEGPTRKRFPGRESYFEMLGKKGVVTVIFDDEKVVAVAAAVPWQGGWKKEGAGTEKGWEIKAVAVHGDPKYLHRGLAVQLYTSLEQYIIEQERSRLFRTEGKREKQTPSTRSVTLWILAAECINGVYWRKRGYQEVRRDTCGAGTWGCLTNFEMVVLRKDVPFEMYAY